MSTDTRNRDAPRLAGDEAAEEWSEAPGANEAVERTADFEEVRAAGRMHAVVRGLDAHYRRWVAGTFPLVLLTIFAADVVGYLDDPSATGAAVGVTLMVVGLLWSRGTE